jgi:hypothetical protein
MRATCLLLGGSDDLAVGRRHEPCGWVLVSGSGGLARRRAFCIAASTGARRSSGAPSLLATALARGLAREGPLVPSWASQPLTLAETMALVQSVERAPTTPAWMRACTSRSGV